MALQVKTIFSEADEMKLQVIELINYNAANHYNYADGFAKKLKF